MRTHVDLAENLRGLDVSLRTGNGQPGAGSGAGVDLIEAAVERMAVALHGRLDGLGIDHVFDDYGPGTHTWPFWQRDLRLELPLIERSFAKPPARPRRFSFTAIQPAYSDYGWKVHIRRPALEFSRLLVEGKRRFALSGSGTAVVRTPPRFEPREAYRVTLARRAGRAGEDVARASQRTASDPDRPRRAEPVPAIHGRGAGGRDGGVHDPGSHPAPMNSPGSVGPL